ncbi:general stress protein [Tenuibacillus multivorans]|uniref:Heat induced stress protein YflT n=1 Tax=Tenuibacillus multivorans TaxID=237069 RepID=A0A1H0G2V9_9BACI|nr:general stress protein [Tenuibacillus multivorans]GEL78102.1 general stress protein 17M [Tenuibacillus multivorans]SDO01226.1 Heat induced stress protein YflT [Tenuibacillus multivorans]
MPFIRDYNNDENMVTDIKKLTDNGVNRDDIFVLTHDDNHTEHIVEETSTNSIDISGPEDFDKKGDELRARLEEVGVSEIQAEQYEEMLDEGKLLLIVNSNHDVENYLH